MKVLVVGSTGCVGRAVVRALRARGHAVVEGSRTASGPLQLRVDFMTPVAPVDWSARLAPLGLDAVVNCVGILREGRQSFERVHARGPIELFRGAALAGVPRIVQVSALGVDDSPATLATPYLRTKLQADDALAALPVEGVVLRPSLVVGPGSEGSALFALLAALPVIGLPGRGDQRLQPLHVYELAEVIARLLERRDPIAGVHELGGPQSLTWREMLATYREAQSLGPALWLPVPMPLMRALAAAVAWLPQRAFTPDTLALLERGNVPAANAAGALLGRGPTPLARALAITPPRLPVDITVRLAPLPHLVLRLAIAFMWLYTAAVSALWPQSSGVLDLLARCGFAGPSGIAALAFSCTLNTLLGALLVWRPLPWVYAAQVVAVVADSSVAAVGMPALLTDHCGPLVKNLPVLAALLIAWLAQPPLPVPAVAPATRLGTSPLK